MDGMGLLIIFIATAFFVVVGLFVWSAVMRMTGRRSRFDRVAETMVRAQGAGIYPPSLRPDPETAVIEENDGSRAGRAVRETPSDQVGDSSPE